MIINLILNDSIFCSHLVQLCAVLVSVVVLFKCPGVFHHKVHEGFARITDRLIVLRKAIEIEALGATLLSASDFFSKPFAFLNGGRAPLNPPSKGGRKGGQKTENKEKKQIPNAKLSEFFNFLADLALARPARRGFPQNAYQSTFFPAHLLSSII